MMKLNRRRFLGVAAGATCCSAVQAIGDQQRGSEPYVRADTDWLARCRYGIGVHWTAQTAARHGPSLSFQEAVDAFDVKKFVDQLAQAGADYLLFTAAHALQMLPAPHPVIDQILPGRTCKRDLLAELADALARQGKHFLVYYNHSCNHAQDRPWEQAVGYHDRDKNRFAQNLMEIVGWMGRRYKDKIKAWWFDSPYSLDPRGPHNSVSTDMTGFQFPWERFTVAAKLGHPGRLVTYNPGVAQTFLYTAHQDYWSGELVDLKTPAKSRYLESGLQWFGWTCLEDRAWVHHRRDSEIPKPLYPDEEVVSFVQTCNAHQAPMTFNVGIYQNGTMAQASVDQLCRLGAALGTHRVSG
jgi:alpha-L-fucosidase